MVKISLIPGIKQSQGIALTPQLLQSIKLFELNNLELEAYLANEILQNPFLEIDQEDSLELSEDLINKSNEDNRESILDIETSQSESPIDDHSNIYDDSSKGSSNELTNIIEETISYKKSIYETLIEQVYLNFSNSIDRNIAFILIQHLEFDGYFKINIQDLSSNINIPEDKINKILFTLKSFEPIGIFSQTLEEFLIIQLNQFNLIDEPMKNLIENLNELALGNIIKLSKICNVNQSEILNMVKSIRRCGSKPLINLDEKDFIFGEPDILVKKISSNWVVELNENTLPRILVNTGYWEELAKKRISKEDKKYLADRYASGKWLIKAVEQ
jgi:RNA polymerase sigma-54 factor